ncbi:hypothetical protein ACVI1I_001784 [Bradyrhizobium sp. USDA 4459]
MSQDKEKAKTKRPQPGAYRLRPFVLTIFIRWDLPR